MESSFQLSSVYLSFSVERKEDCTSRVRPTMFHWKQLITLFEINENRGNFLPEDDSFDSEITDTDAEGSDVVDIYAEEKEGKDGATKKAEKKPGAFLVWEPSKVETQQGAISEIEMGEGVFPDKDTSEAEAPRPFLYYSDEDKTLRDGAHHYFDEDPETDTKAPALTLKTEKLAEDKKLRDAAKRFFDEGPETDIKAPAVSLREEKNQEAGERQTALFEKTQRRTRRL